MKFINIRFNQFIKAWDHFWFKPVDVFPLAGFRFLLCSFLFILYSMRFFDIRMFFYESGLMSSSSAKMFHKLQVSHVLHFILSSDLLLYFAYLSFLVILLALALGFASRWLVAIAFILHLVFIQRNPSIVYGADAITVFWLFYLIFANTNGQIQWVDYFKNKRKQGLVSDRRLAHSWWNTLALRLIQIQLCVVYFFSGLTKLREGAWWNGTALKEALLSYDKAGMDIAFLLSLPVIAGVLTCFIVLFEIYFPVLIWIPRLRSPLLILGVLFHILIAISFGLYFFSLIVMCAYVLFCPPLFLRRLFDRLQS